MSDKTKFIESISRAHKLYKFLRNTVPFDIARSLFIGFTVMGDTIVLFDEDAVAFAKIAHLPLETSPLPSGVVASRVRLSRQLLRRIQEESPIRLEVLLY